MEAQDHINQLVELLIEKEQGTVTDQEITGKWMTTKTAIMFEQSVDDPTAEERLRRHIAAQLATTRFDRPSDTQ